MTVSERVIPGGPGHSKHHNDLAKQGNELEGIVKTGRLSEAGLRDTIDARIGTSSALVIRATDLPNASAIVQQSLDSLAAFASRGVLCVRTEGVATLTKTIYLPSGITLDATGAQFKAVSGCGDIVSAQGQRNALYAPWGLASVASASGGSLAAGDKMYYVTAVDALGRETVPDMLENVAITTGSAGTVALTWKSATVRGNGTPFAKYRVYGRSHAGRGLLAEVTGTNWTDDGSVAPNSDLLPPTSPQTIARTANIALIGGEWDVNGASRGIGANRNSAIPGTWQSGRYRGHGINFVRVDGALVRDVKILHADKWAVAVADFSALVTDNITFDTYSDGIHILGPGRDWRANRLRGTVGDDLVGISAVEWPGYAASEGNVTGVSIVDVDAINTPSVVRMLGGTGAEITDVDVRKVTGYLDPASTFAAGLYVNDNQIQPQRVGTVVRRLGIRDVAVSSGSLPLVLFGASLIDGLTIDGVTRLDSTFGANAVAVAFTGTTSVTENVSLRRVANRSGNAVQVTGGTHPRLSLDECEGRRVTAGGSVLALGNGALATVTNVHVRRSKTNTTTLVTLSGTNPYGNVVVEDSVVDALAVGLGTVSVVSAAAAVASVTVLRSALRGGAAGDNSFVTASTGAAIGRAVVEACTILSGGAGNYSAVYQNTGTIAEAMLRDLALAVQALFKTRNGATRVSLENVAATSGTLIGRYGASSAGSVDISARAATGTLVQGDGTPVTLRSRSAELRADVSLLSKNSGDMVYNTNASLSCGIGVVVCDGTNWKNLFTGATY